jgi:hypothetical protein
MKNYKMFDWKGDVYLRSLNKKEGKKYFTIFMQGAENRVDNFISYLDCEGVKLDYSVASLDYLNKWLYIQIKRVANDNWPSIQDYTKEFVEGYSIPPIARSLANDTSLYIAKMWENNSTGNTIYWGLHSGSKRLEGYNWPDIGGFPSESDKYTYPVVYYIYMYVFRILEKEYSNINECINDRILVRQYLSQIGGLPKGLRSLPPLPEKII